MRFQKFNILLIGSATALLTACDIYESVPLFERIEKTPIELSVGGVDGGMESRAVITTNPYNPLNYFDTQKTTKVFMVMKSTYGQSDYEGSHDPKYTVSRADVAANDNKLVFDANNQKYWDDAHARSSKLSIWAYAQKGMTWTECTFEKDKAGGGYEKDPFQTTNHFPWRTAPIYPFIREWKASKETDDRQTATTVMCQDLLFSNNLVDNSATGTNLGGADADKSLKFNFTERKFPKSGEAVMKFYHAMSKITIKLIEGEGFDRSSTGDFQFASGTNVKLSGFNTKGLFSIQQGIFQEVSQHNDVPTISLSTTNTTADPYYTLEALAIPNIEEVMQSWTTPQHDDYSRFVSGKNDVMMEFTIDGNKYQITSGMLYDALHVDGNPANALVTNATVKTDNGTYIPLEAGKNYVFTFNVGKTKIKNITAQVAEWENVEATQLIPTNARINLNLEERGTTITDAADIYRAEDNSSEITDTWQSYNWAKGYVGHGNVFSNASGSWKLNTDWFWPGNTYHYHFRAIMPGNGATGAPTVKTADEKDYVELTSGTSYTDIRWGAPFTDVTPGNDTPDPTTLNWTYDPQQYGFDGKAAATKHQINYAIGPTEDQIKLILFHMMSELEFIITTSATGSEQVVLGDGNGSNVTKVELLNYYPEGRVLLGNGLVQTTGAKTNAFTLTNNLSASSNNCTFGIVPQAITDELQLRITTPDHNQYYVKLKDIIASAISTNNLANPYTDNKIDRWYPGYKYKYTLNLLKKGVTSITATIVNWETVTAGNDNVQIR